MKNFTLVIDGFGTEDTVNTLMDAIKGTVPVDENDVVVARMTTTIGTKYMDYHTDKEVGDNLEQLNIIERINRGEGEDESPKVYVVVCTDKDGYFINLAVKTTPESAKDFMLNFSEENKYNPHWRLETLDAETFELED